MRKAVCLILMNVLIAQFINGQGQCSSSITSFQNSVNSLDAELRSGFAGKDYSATIANINKLIRSNSTNCTLDKGSLKNWVFIKTRWKTLSADLNIPYRYPRTLKKLSNTYQDFFIAVNELVLIPPVIPVDLIKPIDSLVKKNMKDSLYPVKDTIRLIDSTIRKIDTISQKIDSVSTAISLKTDTVLRSAKFTKRKVEEIDSILRSNVPGKRHLVSAEAYADGLYSLGYAYVFRNKRDTLFPVVAGFEVLFPLNSATVHHLGFFGTGGFYYKHFIMQAGAGYLNRAQYQNISWKGSLDFVSSFYGLGIAYSPLTGTGIRVSFRMGK